MRNLWAWGKWVSRGVSEVQWGEAHVLDHLQKLKVHKAMGPDEIDLWVLKKLLNISAKPLSIIIEKLWQSNEISTDWKTGNIIPMFY